MSAHERSEAHVAQAASTGATGAVVLRSDGTWPADTARLVRDASNLPRPGDVVPLAAYLALERDRRTGVSVWPAPEDDPARLAAHVGALALIAIDFPAFKDGRGYSTATPLRTRHFYRGDLRAIGDITIDIVFYLRRVGFTSFALRADQDPATAAAALNAFSDSYQASVDQPVPYFRRRAARAAAGAAQ